MGVLRRVEKGGFEFAALFDGLLCVCGGVRRRKLEIERVLLLLLLKGGFLKRSGISREHVLSVTPEKSRGPRNLYVLLCSRFVSVIY